jgi:hypothetical protein
MAGTSRTFRTRLPIAVDEQLTAFCVTWNIPVSGAIRLAVAYFLDHQDEAMARLADGPADPRTPEQVAAWEAYAQELAAFDMDELVAQLTPPDAGDDL